MENKKEITLKQAFSTSTKSHVLGIMILLPTSQAFWKTRRPDEAADYRAARRYVYPKKISETLKSVE